MRHSQETKEKVIELVGKVKTPAARNRILARFGVARTTYLKWTQTLEEGGTLETKQLGRPKKEPIFLDKGPCVDDLRKLFRAEFAAVLPDAIEQAIEQAIDSMDSQGHYIPPGAQSVRLRKAKRKFSTKNS